MLRISGKAAVSCPIRRTHPFSSSLSSYRFHELNEQDPRDLALAVFLPLALRSKGPDETILCCASFKQ